MSDIIRRHVGPRLSQAVEHNGVVYLAGQVGDDQDADVATQTKQILAKIDRLFAECGTDKSKLLWAQLWVKEARRRRRTADSNRIPPSALRQTLAPQVFADYLDAARRRPATPPRGSRPEMILW